jgi:hypothetical protein
VLAGYQLGQLCVLFVARFDQRRNNARRRMCSRGWWLILSTAGNLLQLLLP